MLLKENVLYVLTLYTSYEGPSVANHNSRKLGIFGRKLEENHSPFCWYFDQY